MNILLVMYLVVYVVYFCFYAIFLLKARCICCATIVR